MCGIFVSRKIIFLTLILLFSKAKAFKKFEHESDIKSLLENNTASPNIKDIAMSLLEVKEKINTFNISKKDISNITMCQKFYSIGKDLLQLQEQIIDQKTTKKHEIYNSSVNLLMNLYESLSNDMIQLRKDTQIFEDICSKNAVVKAIISRRFSEAESVLRLIKNESLIIQIVHDVYNYDKQNLKLLLDFTDDLSSRSLTSLIVNEILNELDVHNHKDIQMDDIIGILELNILNQKPSKRKEIHKDVESFLKNTSMDIPKKYVHDSSIDSTKYLTNLLAQINKISQKYSNEIIFRVIDRVYEKISIGKIIDNLLSQLHFPQRAYAIVYMFNKIKSDHQLETGVLKLSHYIFDALQNADIHIYLRNLLQSIWDEIPSSVKNLYTGQGICLRNTEKSNYMFAINNKNRTNIFTVKSGDSESQGKWYVENQLGSDLFYFINKNLTDKYLYVSEEKMPGFKGSNHVFGQKIEKLADRERSAWKIKIFGEYMHIRSAFNQDLLCEIANSLNPRQPFVATMPYSLDVKHQHCKWEIKACW